MTTLIPHPRRCLVPFTFFLLTNSLGCSTTESMGPDVGADARALGPSGSISATGRVGDTAPVAFAILAGASGQVGSADGAGSNARFFFPFTVAAGARCNVYVADAFNHTIRVISPEGVVTTIAGQPGISGSADGAGAEALLNNPQGVAADASGNIYVGDTFNYTIRKISRDGIVTTLAGKPFHAGSDDGVGENARFNQSAALAVHPNGDIYVVDTFNHTVRKVTRQGEVTTLAGLAGAPGYVDGRAASARFDHPNGIAVDAAGNIYIGDSGNNRIRKITPRGTVTTVAGSGAIGSVDGFGSAAEFNFPRGVASDNNGNLYVADGYNHAIRKISREGMVSTLAGLAGSSPNDAGFFNPFGVAVLAPDVLVVANTFDHTIRISATRSGRCPAGT